MADTLQPQITALQAQLHDAAAALGLAKQKHMDPQVIAQYQARFDALKSQVDALVAQENSNERPTDFEMTVGSLFDGISSFIADVADAAKNTVKAAGQTISLLPVIVIALVAIVGWLAYKGKLGFQVRR